jgi:hypothetical protein
MRALLLVRELCEQPRRMCLLLVVVLLLLLCTEGPAAK